MAKPKKPTETPVPETTTNDRPDSTRHNGYTRALADQILDRYANGETLPSVCHDLGLHLGSVLRWARDNPTFGLAYTHARLLFADAQFHRALDIAEGAGSKPVMREGKDGRPKVDVAATKMDVHRSRLHVDTIFRIVGKISPEKYGDRLNLHHSGSIAFDGMDDGRLNARTLKNLEDLGVMDLLREYLLADQLAAVLERFVVIELPTEPEPMRALPAPTVEA